MFFDPAVSDRTSALASCNLEFFFCSAVALKKNHLAARLLLCACRVKAVLQLPRLPHLLHLHLQDNQIAHMESTAALPLLQTLDLSFNHIDNLGAVQALSSLSHLHFMRINDNPVQHEPNFFFTLQRLLPWTQHEFGHARHFPNEAQIQQIQQEAVLRSPQVLQACRQGQWASGSSPWLGMPSTPFAGPRGRFGVRVQAVPGNGAVPDGGAQVMPQNALDQGRIQENAGNEVVITDTRGQLQAAPNQGRVQATAGNGAVRAAIG